MGPRGDNEGRHGQILRWGEILDQRGPRGGTQQRIGRARSNFDVYRADTGKHRGSKSKRL